MTASINASTTSGVVLTSDTSGNLALQSNGTTVATAQSTGLSINTYTPATSLITSGTAQATTSGTSVTFTSIPSWVKKITVMFNNVSTSGSSNLLVQIGSGSVTSSGYTSVAAFSYATNGVNAASNTAGFIVTGSNSAASLMNGIIQIAALGSNTWIEQGCLSALTGVSSSGGTSPALGGALDRVVLTTVNGTDTFDNGSINIQYE
jgi:hypothetical protein